MHSRTRRMPLLLVMLCLFAGRVQAEDAEQRRVIGRVSVRGDGFIRVAREDLLKAGATSAAFVRVERGGVPVGVCTSVRGGDLYFLALDTASSQTATAVYELVLADAPVQCAPRIEAVAASEAPADVALHARRRDAEDRVYGALGGARRRVYAGAAPTWFLHRLEHEGTVRRSLDGRHAVGDQRLSATVYGTYVGPIAVAARWGTADLGLAKAEDAAGGTTLTWRVPASSVPRAPAVLSLVNRSPPLPPKPKNDLATGRGRLWIDVVTLDGARIAALDDALCKCTLTNARTLWVRGPEKSAAARRNASVLVLDRRKRAVASVALPAAGPVGPWLRAELPSALDAGWIFTSASARRAQVTRVTSVPDPLAAADRARHVILSVPELLPGARDLAAHRTRTGLPSAAVNVSDVYAAYGYGERTVAALRTFVQRLQERETPLEYLVLAGDAIHDRTDWSSRPMIPAPMTRTLWNGATPCDRLYVGDDGGARSSGASVGRLPFRRAETMRHYVTRLIEHETRPLAHDNRRLLRFLAGESGMGSAVDRLFERGFRMVLDQALDPAFEVEVTYANPASPYYWPLMSMNDKVVRDINAGCLIYTYVGHGTSHASGVRLAWDRALNIFTANEVGAVDIHGPRPMMLVLASSSAAFDLPKREGLGEALLKRPGGPLAYWGATRFCNPVYNVFVAWGLAQRVGRAPRVGDLLDGAQAELHKLGPNMWRTLVLQNAKTRWPDLPAEAFLREGNASYTLLGDPALAFPLPRRDITLAATRQGDELEVTLTCDLPTGTMVHVELVRRRNDASAEPAAVANPDDPASRDKVRAVHRQVNDRVLSRATVRIENGSGRLRVQVPKGARRPRLVAFAVTERDVHHGALVLE